MFEPVDPDELRRKLEPDTKGYDVGQQGLPPLDAVDDLNERPITDTFEGLIQKASARLAEQQEIERNQFDRISSPPPPPTPSPGDDAGASERSADIHAIVRSTEGEFDSVVKARRPELEDKRLEAERRRTDLAKFRADHSLNRREPDYPDKGKRWLMIGILAILLVFESGCNTSILEKAGNTSPIELWIIALGISLLNIGASFLVGLSSRYLGHISRRCRIAAIGGMTSYAVFALVLNLSVAHYRDVSGSLNGEGGKEVVQRIGEGGKEVVERMREDPFGLEEFQSWLLCCLGLLFSVSAFVEGRFFDDSYPRYGRRHRNVRHAREESLKLLHATYDALDQVREDASGLVQRNVEFARGQYQERRRIAKNWPILITAFDNHASYLQQVGEALIGEYRAANRTARPDGTTPMAHRTPWKLQVPEIDRDELPDIEDDGVIEDRLRKLDEEYRSAFDRIHECCEAAKDALTPAGVSTSNKRRSRPANVLQIDSRRDSRSAAS